MILDYDTNTIGYDNKHGLQGANATSVVTVDHRGEVHVDVHNPDRARRCRYHFNVEHGSMRPLDQRLWLEGNLSVAYGEELSNDTGVFALRFEPEEFERALLVPTAAVTDVEVTWGKDFIASRPFRVVCFPYAQHFLSDSPGAQTVIRDRADLEQAVAAVDFERIEPMSTEGLRTMFMVMPVISLAVTLTLLYLWLRT